MQAPEREKDQRRDWIIVLLIILIGLFCILCAGTWALRRPPSWKLNSNMESNLDPNSDFLTARSIGVIEPIDVSILTKPAWMDLYLTPGATFETSAPIPTTVQNTPLPPPATRTITSVPTIFPTLTKTATPGIIIYPTNTPVSLPPTRTSTPPAGPSANLSITLTDGSATYTAGGTLTYTIVVSNPTGPSAVTGATVTDTFPAALSNITWTCTGTNGGICPPNGTGNINHTINLPVGSFVTYTVNATVSPAATGSLTNTAMVTAPVSVPDPVLANNSATDTDTPFINADLRITKTDGTATYIPGTSTTYTIVVTNAGPANVTGATVTDTFPAAITSAAWTCSAGGGAACTTANGSGNISHTVNVPAGGTLTYTVTAVLDASATGSLTNTATVAAPAGVTDPSPLNNSATDTNTPIYNVNLQITKTDGVATYTPGTTTTYTIVVSNAGPSDVVGATVTDNFPAQVTGSNWTCTAANGAACQLANGSGNISQTINVPVGGTVTYSATVNISAAATGPMSNMATVAAPAGYNETSGGDNTATDVDTQVIITADLSITKTSPTTTYSAGSIVTYSITVTNNGPDNVTGATINDPKPAQIDTWGWCVAPCVPAANTSGNLSAAVNLASGASITYSVFANVIPTASGDLVNTATVTAPAGVTDPTGNNTATFTDIPYIDLQITKDDGTAAYTAGGSVTYTVTVTNASTFNLNGVRVEDAIPSLVTTWGWCVAPCVPAANTNADLTATINMPAGSSITYTILANIHANATGDLVNTANVFPPTGYSDAVFGNDSATDTDVNVTGEPEVGPPDGTVLPIGDGGMATFYLSQPSVADGDGAPDFAYHELQVAGTVYIDQLIVEISADSVTWYQVFFWGDTNPDTNTNVDNLNLPNIALVCPTEADNCPIPPTELYNSTGITINVDAFVSPGNYSWIRFREPGVTAGDGAHVDSIEILP